MTTATSIPKPSGNGDATGCQEKKPQVYAMIPPMIDPAGEKTDIRDYLNHLRGQGKSREEILAIVREKCEPATPENMRRWKIELKKQQDDYRNSQMNKGPFDQERGSPKELREISTSNEQIDDPHRLARVYLQRYCRTDDLKNTLRFFRNEWHRWDRSCYQVVTSQEINADLTAVAKREFDADNLEKLMRHKGESDKPKAKPVTKTLVANVTNALQSLAILPSTTIQPSWLCDDPPFPADEVIATRGGLLHLPSIADGVAKIVPPTPDYFSCGAVDYEYDPDARCPDWFRFLHSIWPDDRESIDALQEWFGYLLLPDVRQHKMLMLLGPPRAGKGVMGRVIKSLVGPGNLASPTLASLAGPFGLWPLLGRSVALIADARLSRRHDAVAVVERLLSISGEDPQDVHRKNLPTIAGVKLPVRFVVMTNELPNMRDASGALTTRVILLRLTRNFYGREDRQLGERLEREAAGIFAWATRGWARLRERGAFEQPESGRELLEDLDNLSSPVKQFVRECCIVGPEFSATVDDIFGEWKEWCRKHGRDRFGTRETFGKDLRAAIPGIKRTRPRSDDGGREPSYAGIELKKSATDYFPP